jgi:hypothetical protein
MAGLRIMHEDTMKSSVGTMGYHSSASTKRRVSAENNSIMEITFGRHHEF